MRPFSAAFAAFLASATLAWAQAPRTEEGFGNNYPHDEKASFWLWKWEQLRHGVAGAPSGGWATPWTRSDVARLRTPAAGPDLTWIGHAAFLLRIAGRNVLFDPHFSARASPVGFAGPSRVVKLPLELAELPRIDVVMISHNHYDHLDRDTVKALAAQPGGSPLFLVGLGLREWFAGEGIERVVEMDWWQSRREGPLEITFVPVQHWSKRTLWDTNRTLWGGWVVAAAGLKVVHTGDTGYSRDFRDIGARLGPFDLALVPIGAYAPRWFMKTHHLDVAEALKVREDLRAARAIGMHWGTFEGLTDEPLDEPPAWLARERVGLPREAFDVMTVGETREVVPAATRR